MIKRQLSTLLLVCTGLNSFAQQDFNILHYGAKMSLTYNNTAAIQKTIDAAAKKGGRVIIPPGNFITGPLELKSGVDLHLDDDALLLGSTKRLDYGVSGKPLISAVGQHNVSITGKGIIDGQGRELVENVLLLLREGKMQDREWLLKRPGENSRPMIILFKGCKQVKVNNITIKNSAAWVQSYNDCDGVDIDSMKVQSTAYWNNDGIDIVDSKNVKITNSYFNAADDAICLKSESTGKSCENIIVENCILRSSASGFKLGTGSVGGFKNIRVRNLVVFDTYRSAIALETVDGAYLTDVNISHVKGKNIGNAIFIRLGHRNKDERYSTINNILIDDVKADVPNAKPDIGYPVEGPPPKVAPHNLVPASITGLPDHLVQNVTLKNIEIMYGGNARKEIAFIPTDSLSHVIENPAGYPEFTMFGELPSWGLYTRHASGIHISDFKITLKQDDFRPAMVFDDVSGLDLKKIEVPLSAAVPVLVYRKVTQLRTADLVIPAGDKSVEINNK
ncbi:glycoside hydrolase family 28 protein [Mucilaginibacter ginsenosidivorax]|uniref:Glycoside hydrolase family 28 protein n=1 Tax=Mucilaginibacter ginsenosidivorax TaxID=862126 RepID=A0A5B8W542_9SPHI|nr:glycosyl hydrolase family 28 protein [Mucilaginibacter ginsenosidivorax]QEC78547.1 glycoside hydrolase family 28 protein [Mucilaginibacter ginsenosidivorax]